MIRRYSELKALKTFEERYRYLRLQGSVGRESFGFDRYINQSFYRSREWRDVRNYVILRDNGCDLGIKGRDIVDKILVHHMNPMDKSAIEKGHRNILDPQYLITTTHRTHNAIHYGDASLLLTEFKPRQVGDTRLW